VRKTFRLHLFCFLLLTMCIFFNGCMRTGPDMVPLDQFDYANAIGDAKKQQILMNIVKLRHAEWPVFLEVNQVVAGYNWEQTGSARFFFRRLFDVAASDSAELGYVGRFVERPTITYSPLGGENFVRNILTPARPDSLLSLIESGWPADKLFQTMVQSVNGKRNRNVMYGTDYPADPIFIRFVRLLKKIHIANAISIRIKRTEGQGKVSKLNFRTNLLDSQTQHELDEVKALLGLNPDVNSYHIIWDSISEDPNTIAIQTRSVIQVMVAMALGVEIPTEDIGTGVAIDLKSAQEDIEAVDLSPLMQIHSGASAPKDAFVMVRYQDNSFWIDRHDHNSKISLAYLTLLLTVTESTDVEGPQLTISTN